MLLNNQHRPLGRSGFSVPPVVFGTAALGNVDRVITDQSKLALCGELLRHVAPPVWIEVSYQHGNGMALEVLGRVLRRLDVADEEVSLQLAIDLSSPKSNGAMPPSERIAVDWQKACQLLGDAYRPKLISINVAEESVWQAACEFMAAQGIQGCGLAVTDWRGVMDRVIAIEPDWISLSGGCSIMRHSPELLAFMRESMGRQTPIVIADVFEDGFLLGGTHLDGLVMNAETSAGRNWLAWRKTFVALCNGHGISPADASIQFALSLPGVVAVRLESSYPDRVGENIVSICRKMPANFWESMKEEGLLSAEHPSYG